LSRPEHFLALPKVNRIEPILLKMLTKKSIFPHMEEEKLLNFLQETPIFFYSKLKMFTFLVEELTPIFNVHGT
jgi:hypothetical protein